MFQGEIKARRQLESGGGILYIQPITFVMAK
jgi:hypothetical protein